jgi:hypothetical protein
MAGLFAVFTRIRKPNADRYSRAVGAIVSTLTCVEKADLYATGKAPERLDADSQKLLRAAIKDIWAESDSYPIYEGRVGASPRECAWPSSMPRIHGLQVPEPDRRRGRDRRPLPAQK